MGPWVVRTLVQDGHEVSVFHRGATEDELPVSVRHVHGSFEAMPTAALRALEPEVVVDMTPFVRADARRLMVFEGIARRGVAVSSADVYRAFGRLWRCEPGPPDPLPLGEDSPLRTVVIDETYDKLGVEEELRSRCELPVTIIRAPPTHGPRDDQHRLYRYVRRMADGRPAVLLDATLHGWRWARGYVEDVAHAIALAVVREDAAGRTYNVADAIAHTEAEWVRAVGAVFGWHGKVVAVPTERLPAAMRADQFDLRQHFVIDSSRIRTELGYTERVAAEEALRRTIDWELANPPSSPDDAFDYEAEESVLTRLRFDKP
jgi:nucleoside-diphosphate-sugar epimerase